MREQCVSKRERERGGARVIDRSEQERRELH